MSFGDAFTAPRPREFPFTSPPLIAPFWHDFNLQDGGSIFYRQTNDSAQLQLVHNLLLDLDGGELSTFYPTLLFIATWDQVPPYGGPTEVHAPMRHIMNVL